MSKRNGVKSNSGNRINSETSRTTTPFGYFGSKNRLGPEIVKMIPPHNCWVEAFCGSAAITLAKSPAPIEIINDIDMRIVNLFRQLRDNFKDLKRVISLTPYSRDEFEIAQAEMDYGTDLERARKFLVASMMAINGVFGPEKGGFSISNSYSRSGKEARVNRWNNLATRLEEVVERLKRVRIENKDARILLKDFVMRPATLVYLDPPYLAKRSNGYNHDANDKTFHEELLDLAVAAKCMILISGYSNATYESLLLAENGWIKKEIKTHTRGSSGKQFDRTELLWMNQALVKSYTNSKIPIRLTALEAKQKKLNPSRT